MNKEEALEQLKLDMEGLVEPEVKEPVAEAKEEVETSEEAPKYTEIEQKAMEQGWKPDYHGDDRVDADEYIKRGSFFKKISSQNTQIKELRETLKSLTSHLKKTEKAAYEKALSDILHERQKAVEEGDTHAFNMAEQKLELTQQQIQQVETDLNFVPSENVQQEADVIPEVKEFYERNKGWFNDDPKNKAMVATAKVVDEAVGKLAAELGEKLTPAQHLERVEAEMKTRFPDRFENPKKERPAAVGVSTTASSNPKASLANKLSPYHKSIVKQLAATDTSMSEAEWADYYAKQLESYGELKK